MNCYRLIRVAMVISLLSANCSGPAPEVSGELKQWHKVTLTVNGPEASETDSADGVNTFTDYAMTVRFEHESGSPSYEVPGYFAADGMAAQTSATSGNKWRAHVSPDKTGVWTYEVSFLGGPQTAVNGGGEPLSAYHGSTGQFTVAASDKSAPDFRGRGRLEYDGTRYLRFAGDGTRFLKAGPDAPETFLAYEDFDGTSTEKTALKSWEPHVADWREGDPTWQDGRGKGIIGALNYLADEGLNAFSFLPYNAQGDGDNVWPHASRLDKLHFDVSKLDQWQIVFDHAQSRGLYLHFKLQENEIDDNRRGQQREPAEIEAALDGGALGVERKLYLRELVARFGYALALNWNLGEENSQTKEEQLAMASYIGAIDPYDHLAVVHTFPRDQDDVYTPLLGEKALTGVSLQNRWDVVHQRTLKWVRESEASGHVWVVANDEQGPASQGVPPDPGYEGFDGADREGNPVHTLHDIRKYTLWANLMAGGAGVEYYFGYQLPQNDLILEDFRSRDLTWDYCRHALSFFHGQNIPFWEMQNADMLVGNEGHDNSRYAFAAADSIYVVFLPDGGSASLDLGAASGTFQVRWFDPRNGGDLAVGSVEAVEGGGKRGLGNPPSDPGEDWVVLVRK